MISLFVVGTALEDLQKLEKLSSELVQKLLQQVPSISFQGYFNSSEKLRHHFSGKQKLKRASIIINTSGGTEDYISVIVEMSDAPVLILADPKGNSLASSLESYAYFKNFHRIKIAYAENDNSKAALANAFNNVITAINKINNSTFCLIGEPSDWLLTSRNFQDFGSFKTKLKKLKINELVKRVESINKSKCQSIIENWKSRFNEILVDENSLIDSAKVYIALKEIVEENKADFLSIRCFDLLKYNYTACMAISMCNDQGITSGCEGDIPTTFTMMVAQLLSGDAVWMANPSSLNKDRNEIVFAHCTVPTTFLSDVSSSGLTTHMESNKSTAIRGPLNPGEVTIMRFASTFDKVIAVRGKIVQSDMKNANLCRTQAVIKIEGDVEEWMNETFGNHHVIVYGNLIPQLEHFCDFTDVELIKI